MCAHYSVNNNSQIGPLDPRLTFGTWMKTNSNRSQAATQSQFTPEDVSSSVPTEEDASLVNSITTLVDDETVNQDRPSGKFVSQDGLSLVSWCPLFPTF